MKSKMVNCHVHSTYSILDGCGTIKDIVLRAKELNQEAIAITDHGTVSGILQFYEECNEAGIKPIIGCEFYCCVDNPASLKDQKNRKTKHLIVLAKNLEGYKDLIWLNNISNNFDNYYYTSRIDIDIASKVGKNGNLIGMSACMGGIISSELFVDSKLSSSAKTVEECKSLLKDNWLEIGIEKAKMWSDAFCGNFYLEIQDEGIPMQLVIKKCLRDIGKKTGIKVVCTGDPHFAKPEDAIAHEVIICSQTNKTLEEREDLRVSGEDILFSDNSGYYIKDYSDMKNKFSEDEIACTLKIADQIEKYEIELTKPKLPVFPVPENYNNIDEFVWDLCQTSMKEKNLCKKEYIERLEYEFNVFKNAKINGISLNNYFLILWDIIKEVERLGSKAGVGRGSAAGCLISYLLNITRVDPIEYGLLFQRFFNTGRLSEGRISLPDIDLDVSADIRGDIISYLKSKWGENNVIQIATFGKLQPKAAIKEVFRARGVDFEKANVLTKVFPDEEIKHDDNASYTIEDALRLSDEFREAMEPYKAELELAKRIEGVIKSRGIHAAGVLISSDDINTFLPISYDTKSKSYMCSFEMGDAEKLCVKIDVLGLKLLTVFDLCQAKINKNNVDKSCCKLVKSDIDRKGKKMERPVEFSDMVSNYFNDNGYVVKEYPWGFIEVEKGDLNMLIFIENSSKNIFKNRNMSLDSFLAFCNNSTFSYYVITYNKDTNDVYVVPVIKIISGDKNIEKFGKIIDNKIVKGA